MKPDVIQRAVARDLASLLDSRLRAGQFEFNPYQYRQPETWAPDHLVYVAAGYDCEIEVAHREPGAYSRPRVVTIRGQALGWLADALGYPHRNAVEENESGMPQHSAPLSCSKCGHLFIGTYTTKPPKYCPNCSGAVKVGQGAARVARLRENRERPLWTDPKPRGHETKTGRVIYWYPLYHATDVPVRCKVERKHYIGPVCSLDLRGPDGQLHRMIDIDACRLPRKEK